MGCNQSPSHPWPSISQACRTVEQIQKDVHYSGSAELGIVLLEQPQELQRNRLEHLILVPLSTRISTKIQTRDGSFIHMHASIQCVNTLMIVYTQRGFMCSKLKQFWGLWVLLIVPINRNWKLATEHVWVKWCTEKWIWNKDWHIFHNTKLEFPFYITCKEQKLH